MNDTDRELMQQALEALNAAKNSHGVLLTSDPPRDAWKFYRVGERCSAAIEALRARLEQPDPALQEIIFAERSEGVARSGFIPVAPTMAKPDRELMQQSPQPPRST